MTIYIGKHPSKKDEDVKPLVPCAFIIDPNTLKKKKVILAKKRICCNFYLLAVLFGLIIILFGIGIIYKRMHSKKFEAFCSVQYVRPEQLENSGSFIEHIDIEDDHHERIIVPAFKESLSSSVLHDFDKNVSAIVDPDLQRCFLLDLDRSLVKPPNDLMDLIKKIYGGYYLPKTTSINMNYRAILPPVKNLQPYGYFIWEACRDFNSFKLIKKAKLSFLVKRSVPSFNTYAFNAGRMTFYNIDQSLIH